MAALLSAAGSLLLGLAPIRAQSVSSVNIDLGVFVDTVSPGDKVKLPVIFVAGDGSKITRLSLQASYPSKELTFVEALPGPGPKSSGGSLEAGVSDGAGEEKLLQIELVSVQPIPQGEIASITFEISKHVRMDKQITIRNLKRVAVGADGKPVEAYGVDGSITALTPMSACFFYMH